MMTKQVLLSDKTLDNSVVRDDDNYDYTVPTELTDLMFHTSGIPTQPVITWGADSDTGIHRVGPDSVGIDAGAGVITTVTSSSVKPSVQWLGPAGTAAAPTYAFSADSNSGVYSSGTQTTAISTGGGKRFSVSPTLTEMTTPITTTNSTDSSSSTTGSLITTGGIGCAKKLYVGTSIFFPTAGQTATALSTYEEYTFSTTFGPIWASNVAIDIRVVIFGGNVIYYIPENASTVATSTGATLQASTNLPARYLAAGNINTRIGIPMIVLDNGVKLTGVCRLENTGNFRILKTSGATFGASGGVCGWQAFSFSH